MLIKNSYTTVAANLTGFASNVTGAAFTLTANSAADSVAHKVTIRNDAAVDHSGKTVTLVGTAFDGSALTEVVTGPNTSATVTSTGYFLTLTSATPSATIGADTFDIGWAAAALSPPVPIRNMATHGQFALGVSVDGSGAYSLQQSYGGEWFANATIATKTASADGAILFPVMALRLIFTAATTAVLNVLLAD